MEAEQKQHFTFVHGWGSGPGIWSNLAEALQAQGHKHELSFIELEFVDGSLRGLNERRLSIGGVSLIPGTICVGHSLGTLWLLKHYADLRFVKGFVSINGFYDFSDFVPERQLGAMKKRLARTPLDQMEAFWQLCDMESSAVPETNLHIERLQEGLDWLAQWTGKDELLALECPVLALAGDQDRLLHPDIMKEHWGGFELHFCENAGHSLPQSHAHWCAKQIKEMFL